MAVIYDMDGVVADTEKIHAAIEAKMLASFGIEISPDEISRRFSGMSLRDQFTVLFSEVGRPSPYSKELSDLKVAYFCERADEIVGIEGTIECIHELHGRRIPLAIASASRPQVIELVLNKLGIKDRFSAIASSSEVKRGKPAPDVFLLAAQRLGVRPGSCVVVEDGISGMIGARAAGMYCVALVRDTRQKYPADFIVDDLRKIPMHWLFK